MEPKREVTTVSKLAHWFHWNIICQHNPRVYRCIFTNFAPV